jgi:hypothetical protein
LSVRINDAAHFDASFDAGFENRNPACQARQKPCDNGSSTDSRAKKNAGTKPALSY